MATAEELANGKGKANKKGGKTSGASGRLGEILNGTVAGSDVGRGWDEVDPRHIIWLLLAITRLQGAVMFGRSRDGQALMVKLLLDGESQTVWIAPNDVAETVLAGLAEKLETA